MKTALLCAQGIGDGLLMMIAHRALTERGDEVIVFHDKHALLAPLFPHASFAPPPSHYEGFEQLIVQNDNSERVWNLMRGRKSLPPSFFLHPKHCREAVQTDCTFDLKRPFASNIAQFCLERFDQPFNKDNGLHLSQKGPKILKRIAIHPTSADVKRNWLPVQFVTLARKLKAKGFNVAFTVSADERPYWEFVEEWGIELPSFASLSETAHYLSQSEFFIGNDSGLGHLASNLGVPTLTISGNRKRVKQWRPDWAPGAISTPLIPLPNFKGIGLRMRDSFWQSCLPVTQVYLAFLKAYETHCPHSR